MSIYANTNNNLGWQNQNYESYSKEASLPLYQRVVYTVPGVALSAIEKVGLAVDSFVELAGGDFMDEDTVLNMANILGTDFKNYYTENRDGFDLVGNLVAGAGVGMKISSTLRTGGAFHEAVTDGMSPGTAKFVNNVLFHKENVADANLTPLVKAIQQKRKDGMLDVLADEEFAKGVKAAKVDTAVNTAKDIVWSELGVGLAFYDNDTLGIQQLVENPGLPLAIGGALSVGGGVINLHRLNTGVATAIARTAPDVKDFGKRASNDDVLNAVAGVADYGALSSVIREVSTRGDLTASRQSAIGQLINAQQSESLLRSLSGSIGKLASHVNPFNISEAPSLKAVGVEGAKAFGDLAHMIPGTVLSFNSKVLGDVKLNLNTKNKFTFNKQMEDWGKKFDLESQPRMKLAQRLAMHLTRHPERREAYEAILKGATSHKTFGTKHAFSEGEVLDIAGVPLTTTKGVVKYQRAGGVNVATARVTPEAVTLSLNLANKEAVLGSIGSIIKSAESTFTNFTKPAKEMNWIEIEAMEAGGHPVGSDLVHRAVTDKYRMYTELSELKDEDGFQWYTDIEKALALNLPVSEGVNGGSRLLEHFKHAHATGVDPATMHPDYWSDVLRGIKDKNVVNLMGNVGKSPAFDPKKSGGWKGNNLIAQKQYTIMSAPNEVKSGTDAVLDSLFQIDAQELSDLGKIYAEIQPGMKLATEADAPKKWARMHISSGANPSLFSAVLKSGKALTKDSPQLQEIAEASRVILGSMAKHNASLPFVSGLTKNVKQLFKVQDTQTQVQLMEVHRRLVALNPSNKLTFELVDSQKDVYRAIDDGKVLEYEAGTEVRMSGKVAAILSDLVEATNEIRTRYNTVARMKNSDHNYFSNGLLPSTGFEHTHAMLLMKDGRVLSRITGRSLEDAKKRAAPELARLRQQGDGTYHTEVERIEGHRALDMLEEVSAGTYTGAYTSDAGEYTKNLVQDVQGLLKSLDTSAWELSNGVLIRRARKMAMARNDYMSGAVSEYDVFMHALTGRSVLNPENKVRKGLDVLDNSTQWAVNRISDVYKDLVEQGSAIGEYVGIKGKALTSAEKDELLFNETKDLLGKHMPWESVEELKGIQSTVGYRNANEMISDLNNVTSYMFVRALSIPNMVLNYVGALVNTPSIARMALMESGKVDADALRRLDPVSLTMEGIKSIRKNPHITKIGLDAGVIGERLEEATSKELGRRSKLMTHAFELMDGRKKVKVAGKEFDPLTVMTSGSDYQVRQMAFHIGYNLADKVGIETELGRVAFATRVAQDSTGVYTYNNRAAVFQSGVTSSAALFTTYTWNWFESLFEMVGKGQGSTAARMLLMQAGIFGSEGTPGVAQLLDLIDKANNDDGDMIDKLYTTIGKDNTDLFLMGSLGNLPKLFGGDGLSIFTSGSLAKAPQVSALSMPANISMVRDFYTLFAESADQAVASGGWSVQQTAEIVSLYGVNRAVKGLATLISGKLVDRNGDLIDASIDSPMEYLANGLALKTMSQHVRERQRRADQMKRRTWRQERQKIVRRLKRAIRDGVDVSEQLREIYEATGGRPGGYKRWLNYVYTTATSTKSELEFARTLGINDPRVRDFLRIETMEH